MSVDSVPLRYVTAQMSWIKFSETSRAICYQTFKRLFAISSSIICPKTWLSSQTKWQLSRGRKRLPSPSCVVFTMVCCVLAYKTSHSSRVKCGNDWRSWRNSRRREGAWKSSPCERSSIFLGKFPLIHWLRRSEEAKTGQLRNFCKV